MTESVDWRKPVILERMRAAFVRSPELIDSMPGNLCLIGIISGYRVINQTPEFREIQFDVSQGYNDEIRIVYQGKTIFRGSILVSKETLVNMFLESSKLPYTLNFNGFEAIGHIVFVRGFRVESYDYDYISGIYVVNGKFQGIGVKMLLTV